MKTHQANNRTKMAKAGWGLLLGMSAMLILAGSGWYFALPQMALENIAEYASLNPEALMQSFGIIALIARGYGAGFASVGLMALLVALEGYRNGTRWVWITSWVLVLAYAFLAGIFMLAGESYALSLGVLSFGMIALVGLLMARKDLVR